MSGSGRVAISAAQRTRLLQEVQGICPFCGLELIGSLQAHHIDHDRGNTVDANLMAVCASCHDQLTKHLIPDSEVAWRKRALQNGVHPAKRDKPDMKVGDVDNRGGIIAQQFQGKVVFQTGTKTRSIILPGSIGESPTHYNYVEYLVKRLTEFREAGASFGQRRTGRIHDGGTRKTLANELGGLPKDQLLARFDDVTSVIKSKIDNTALGRRNNAQGTRNYHSFEEHGTKRKR